MLSEERTPTTLNYSQTQKENSLLHPLHLDRLISLRQALDLNRMCVFQLLAHACDHAINAFHQNRHGWHHFYSGKQNQKQLIATQRMNFSLGLTCPYL